MPRNGIVESYGNSFINLLFLSLSLSLVFHNLSISVKSTFKFGEHRGQISLKTFFKFCLFSVNLFSSSSKCTSAVFWRGGFFSGRLLLLGGNLFWLALTLTTLTTDNRYLSRYHFLQ